MVGYHVSNNDLKEIALGACAVVIMSLVLIVVGLAYTLENYEPDDTKLTFPALWQTAYGQEHEQRDSFLGSLTYFGISNSQ